MFPTTHTEAGQSCGALTAVQELVLVSLTLQIAHRRAPRQPVRRCSCITLRELAGEADPGGFVQLQGSAGRPQPRLASGSPCARCLLPGSTPTEPGTGSPPPVPGWSASSGRPPAPRRPRPRLLAPRSPAPSPPRRFGGRQRAAEPRRARGGDGRCPQRCAAGARRGPAGAGRGLGPSGLSIPPARSREPSGAPAWAEFGGRQGRSTAGLARPVRCPGPGGGPRNAVPRSAAPSRPPQKRPCAGPVIANHQSPLITADEAGGGGAFPGAGCAGGSGEPCPGGAGAEGGTRP